MTELMGESNAALMKQASSGEIAMWSDEKKKEFVETFNARAKAGRWILQRTADMILKTALRRQFISEKHTRQLGSTTHLRSMEYRYPDYDLDDHNQYGTVGGRPISDLDTIARERAELVLKELPPLKKAVSIIDAETAKRIERKEKIVEQLRKLKERLEDDDLNGPVRMSDVDPKMSVGDFMKMVELRVKTRKSIFRKMDELAIEGNKLNAQIDKVLYKGLPGLSDAVVSIVQQHLDRATALDEMSRRVGERVMFGDSEAALEMLKSFEKDEQTIPDEVRAEFQKALEKLRVSKKQLGKGKK
jgi:hypothetical protein